MTIAATTDAYESLRLSALEAIKDRKLDPEADPGAIATVVAEEVATYQRRVRAGMGGRALVDPDDVAARLLRSLTDWGVLTAPLADPDVEEIFGAGGDVWYLDGQGRLACVDEPTSEAELRQLVNRLLRTAGRHVDVRRPMVQARVLDGRARLGVVIPPVADQLSFTLRKYTLRHHSLADLVALDTLSRPAADLLGAAMRTRAGVLVSGPPGSGKTTLVNALLRAVPASHRVLGCEETRELSAPLLHGCYYQTRPAGPDEGDGEVSLRDLVRLALGMRPDLIVVGEVRGAEAYELTRAANAGCGVICTIHANSAREALQALTSTAIMAGQNVPAGQVRAIFSTTIDLVVHLDREDTQFRDESAGRIARQVTEIAAVPALQGATDDYTTEPLFERADIGAALRWTGAPVPEGLARRLERVTRSEDRGVARLLEGRSRARRR